MRIKLLGNVDRIGKGTIIPVRKLKDTEERVSYQAIEDPHKGTILVGNPLLFIELEDKKTFTEKEVQAIEQVHLAKLEKLSGEKDRAIELVTNMSKQLVKKNAEIEKLEFYVSALSIGLSASSEAIQILRGKEKV
jgi:hypothetical protein